MGPPAIDISTILQAAIALVVPIVGYLLKRAIDANDRRQEENREEANKRLELIAQDLKVLVGAISDQRGDHRVLEERFRKCEADSQVQAERLRKTEEELSLTRSRYHELSGKVQVILARMDRRAPAPAEEVAS